MRTVILGLGLSMLAMLAGPVMANGQDLPNELVNGDFETGSLDPWTKTGSGGVSDQGPFGIPTSPNGGSKIFSVVESWGGDWGAPKAVLRQVVDESQFPGWDPALNQKQITINFDRFLAARSTEPARNVGLKVFIDYMDDGSFPDPFESGYHRDEVYNEVVDAADIWADQLAWEHKTIDILLPTQPRYLSLEMEFYTHFAEWSWIGVDNVDLEGRCVPEPASLSMLLLAVLPLIRRRR